MTNTDRSPRARAPVPRGRLPEWAWDTLAIAAVLITSVQLVVPGFINPGLGVLVLFTAGACAVLLLFRRQWPVPTLAGCLMVFVATVLAGIPLLSAGIAATVAAFTVASRTDRRTGLIAGGIATGTIATLSVVVAHSGPFDLHVFQIAAAVAIAWAVGDSARSRREYIVAVTERAERAEQTREAEAQRRVAEERLRIAQDLHDTVAHNISVISLNAGVASGAIESSPQRAQEALSAIRSSARGVLAEIGELLRYLRTDDDITAPMRPEPTLRDLDSLIQHITDGGLSVRTEVHGDLSRVAGMTDIVGYRVIQEGLTNALKHGSAPEARLLIDVDEQAVRVTIANPSRGDSPSQANPSSGLGLTGIRERVSAIRGTVRSGSSGGEHQLFAYLPLAREPQS